MHPRTAPKSAPDSGDGTPRPAAAQATRKRPPRHKLAPDAPLTRRQKTICRTYFAYGCKTLRAAQALGIDSSRVRRVKARQAAVAYLDALEEDACHMLATAQAARILAPMLG